MKKVPTAKEYNFEYRYRIGKRYTGTLQIPEEIEMMQEFAKIQLKAQQDAILKILELRGEHNNIEKNIIVNAYPLTNIS